MGTDIGKSQRDAIKQLSPPWASSGTAEKILYNLGLASDALLEKMSQAMQARMPGRGPASALPIIGNDRVMAQGPSESNDNFASRLTRAFDAWQRAGSNRSILDQVLGYVSNPLNVSPTQVPIGAVVGNSGDGAWTTWDVYYNTSDFNAAPHHQRVGPANWNWDGSNSAYWRRWLVLYFPLVLSATTGAAASVTTLSGGFMTVTGLTGMTSDVVGKCLLMSGAASSSNNGTFQISEYISATSVKIASPDGVAGDANNGALGWTLGSYPAIAPAPAIGTPGKLIGDATFSIGLSVTSGYMSALRSLVRLWKEQNEFFPWIIISFAGGDGRAGKEFSPLSTPGAGNPDGTWGSWGKTVNGVVVRARSSGVDPCKFDAVCDGTAIYTSTSWVPTT